MAFCSANSSPFKTPPKQRNLLPHLPRLAFPVECNQLRLITAANPSPPTSQCSQDVLACAASSSDAVLYKRDGKPARDHALVDPAQPSASPTAVSSNDPRAVQIVTQAKQDLLTEEAMNKLLDQDSLETELAKYLPCETSMVRTPDTSVRVWFLL